MHPSHYRPDLKPIDQPLYVVTMLSNHLRWRSRYWNYHQFEREVESAGAILYTAEIALGERPFELTRPACSQHLQLRTTSELWHKENALNLLIARLPKDAKYIAWIDSDIQFSRPDWAQETIQQLQHYPVIQMFSQAQDMDEGYVVVGEPAQGFAFCHQEQMPAMRVAGPLADYYSGSAQGGIYWHPGFAWAARRDALDSLGGLLDCCIYASADWHMAMGLIGRIDETLTSEYTPIYRQWVSDWGRRAERHIQRNLGYLPGLILHHWHGAKIHRGYQDRYRLMKTFNPLTDIHKDTQGLWALNPDDIELRDNLRRYARSRREDG